MRKGDQVRCLSPPLLAGRVGIVEIPRSMGEVGVSFGKNPTIYWFKPSELQRTENDGSTERGNRG